MSWNTGLGCIEEEEHRRLTDEQKKEAGVPVRVICTGVMEQRAETRVGKEVLTELGADRCLERRVQRCGAGGGRSRVSRAGEWPRRGREGTCREIQTIASASFLR